MVSEVYFQGDVEDLFSKNPELMQESVLINSSLLDYEDVEKLNSNGVYISGLVRRKQYSEFNHDGFGYIKKEVYENPMIALSSISTVCDVRVDYDGNIILTFD